MCSPSISEECENDTVSALQKVTSVEYRRCFVVLTYNLQGGNNAQSPGLQAALLTTVLARQAAAAVGVGTCWPWETAATLPSARRRKALRRPRGRRRAGAYRGGRPPTACLSKIPALHSFTSAWRLCFCLCWFVCRRILMKFLDGDV